MKHFFSKLFGTVNERKLKEMQPRVDIVNSFEGKFKKLTDQELKNKTEIFRSRLQKGATEDEFLEEAFATVREAASRTLNVPLMLVSKYCSGVNGPPAWKAAPKCRMISWPFAAVMTSAWEARSPSIIFAPIFVSLWLCLSPGQTKPDTSCPCWRKCFAMLAPIRPVTPVTRIFMRLLFLYCSQIFFWIYVHRTK